MRQDVDLVVNVLGANAVEYKLCGRGASHFSGAWVIYLLWAGAAYATGSWYAERDAIWLRVGAIAALLAALVTKFSGSVVIEESVLVVPSMGVQLSRFKRNGAKTVQFIDQAEISAVVVNEAISFSNVVYYIAFMLHKSGKMVLAFEHFRPRIALQQEMFMQIKSSLFPDSARMAMPEFA